MFDDLPEPIVNHILETLNLNNWTPKPKPRNTVAAKGLIGCLRKLYFERNFPRYPNETSIWAIYWGILIDKQWTTQFKLNQVKSVHYVDGKNKIVGVYDYMYDNKIYDLKIKVFQPIKTILYPFQIDVAQVAYYAAVNEIDNAGLLYANMTGYKQFDVVNDRELLFNVADIDTIDEVKELFVERAKKYFSLQLDKEKSDDCRFCDYKGECNKYDKDRTRFIEK